MKNCLKLLFLLVGGALAWYYYSAKATSDTDSLFLQNVEALASDESLSEISCWGVGSIDCPKSHAKVEFAFVRE